MQDGAVVARLAHNQKVGGSTPSPATNFPGRVLGNSPVYALKATWEKAESEVRSSLGRGAGHPVSYRPLPLPFSTARNVLAEGVITLWTSASGVLASGLSAGQSWQRAGNAHPVTRIVGDNGSIQHAAYFVQGSSKPKTRSLRTVMPVCPAPCIFLVCETGGKI